MKQSVSPVVIGIVAVVAVLVLGFFGYRAFTPAAQDPNPPSQADQINRMQQQSGRYSSQAPGGPPSGSTARQYGSSSYGGGQYMSGGQSR